MIRTFSYSRSSHNRKLHEKINNISPVENNGHNVAKKININNRSRLGYVSSLLFFSALFWEFLLLGIFISNNYFESNSKYVFNSTNILYKSCKNFNCNNDSFLVQMNFYEDFRNFSSPNKRSILKGFVNFNKSIDVSNCLIYNTIVIGYHGKTNFSGSPYS